jgi:2-polyprenyl-3-methyl-5-hydroxy-6-metoxy-1,4-benzoquinol methylase
MNCRHCGAVVMLPFLDLGAAPLSNAFLTSAQLREPELWYPLRLLACTNCWLVQTDDYAGRESIFTNDYVYFSSISSSWVVHARHYVEQVVERFGLGAAHRVAEVAANDGYLLQFVQERGIPCYGIEPTQSTADAARARGLDIVGDFFGVALAARLVETGRSCDLIVANNVLAHVPDINDFVAGFERLLKPAGVVTFEFPHLIEMVRQTQFDTAYHEHYSYLSLTTVARILSQHHLQVFDVETLPTHGGSLRVFAQRRSTGVQPVAPTVAHLLSEEDNAGIRSADFYAGFQREAERVKNDFVSFLIEARRAGRRVAGYGAAAKGNTLLNFAGVKSDLLAFVCDLAPSKQGRYLPGSRIPVLPPSALAERRPDDVVILPWNIAREIVDQFEALRSGGARFVTFVPRISTW